MSCTSCSKECKEFPVDWWDTVGVLHTLFNVGQLEMLPALGYHQENLGAKQKRGFLFDTAKGKCDPWLISLV
ncbi:7152_t:CDS:2 [Funneliformis mosseae]|uniref:7152_t:CDS:1 n=1 Tax=Funneliformis mosseae TaxID=27381 RepID=A0A9N8V455_FUNMO|nr:7152_t:CDS:2 [Funneliformis mosseae]